jgi:single-stranded DNA-binding protein
MRINSTSHFIGSVKLTGDFQTYYVQAKRKTNVIFCETRLAPAQPNNKEEKPLTRVIIYFFGRFGTEVKMNYKKGDYVVVQGRLKVRAFAESEPKLEIRKNSLDPFNNFSIVEEKGEYQYHLHVSKISPIYQS